MDRVRQWLTGRRAKAEHGDAARLTGSPPGAQGDASSRSAGGPQDAAPFPADRVRHARSLLGPDTAAAIDDIDEAIRVVEEGMLRHHDFPPPLDDVPPEWRTAERIEVIRRLADAADRALVLGPTHADAPTTSNIALSARVFLHTVAGPAEGALLGLTGAVDAHYLHAAGHNDDARALAEDAARMLTDAALRDPERAQPGLVLAHDAWVLAAKALGHAQAALERVQRALVMLRRMAARDAYYVADLQFHLLMLATLHGELGHRDQAQAAVQEMRSLGDDDAASAPDPEAPTPPGTAPASGTAPDAPPGSAAPSAALRKAEALCERGIALGREQRWRESEAALADAVAAYRQLHTPTAAAGLARVLWRQAMVLQALERGADAMVSGREGLQILRKLLRSPAAEADQWTEQLARGCTDLSVIAGANGLADEALALAIEAVDLCRSRPREHPSTMTELGTTLHNLSVAYANRAVAQPQASDVGHNLQAAVGAVNEAVTVREGLIVDDAPLTSWELANSLQHRGRIMAMTGRHDEAARDLSRAAERALRLGPGGMGLVQQVVEFAKMLDRMRPGVFAGTPIATLLR